MIECRRQRGAMAHILSTLVSLSLAYTQGHGIRNVMEYNNYNIIEVLIVVVVC